MVSWLGICISGVRSGSVGGREWTQWSVTEKLGCKVNEPSEKSS